MSISTQEARQIELETYYLSEDEYCEDCDLAEREAEDGGGEEKKDE